MFISTQRVYGSLTYLIYWKGKIVGAVEGKAIGDNVCDLLNAAVDDSVQNETDAKYAVELAKWEVFNENT